MQEKSKKKIIITTITILLVIVAIVGVSYAYWILYKAQDGSNKFSAACVDINLSDASSTTGISLKDIWPTSDEEALNDTDNVYSFTVTNNCEKAIDYAIGLLDITEDSSNEFKYSSISIILDESIIGTYNTINNIAAPDNEEKQAKVLAFDTVPAKKNGVAGTKTHSVKLFINESSSSDEISKKFLSKLFVSAGQDLDEIKNNSYNINNKETLYAMIQNKADTTTVIDFNENSEESNTNGVYTTNKTNSNDEVYYYRGAVNNLVVFADACWNIVRTTETGGVKLIYSGIPEYGICTQNNYTKHSIKSTEFNDINIFDRKNPVVGYMRGNYNATTYATAHNNLYDSTAKSIIDDWYVNNIQTKGYSSYIEDTIYCNDRNITTGTGVGKDKTEYAASSRLVTDNINPTLVCKNTTGLVPENNDSFTVSSTLGNGKLTYPIGMLTADEAVFAGYVASSTWGDRNENLNNYLNGTEFYTMTPAAFPGENHGSHFLVRKGTVVLWGWISSIRPVLSLKSGIMVVAGNGTEENPYIVQ